MSDKYIAYHGEKFIIEWYFDARGKSEVSDYFESLPLERKKKISHLFTLMGDRGKIHSPEKFLHEGDQIYVFKTMADRFFCFFFEGAKIILTNAYEKKSNKIPSGEKERAIRAKLDYKERCSKGCYYD